MRAVCLAARLGYHNGNTTPAKALGSFAAGTSMGPCSPTGPDNGPGDSIRPLQDPQMVEGLRVYIGFRV